VQPDINVAVVDRQLTFADTLASGLMSLDDVAAATPFTTTDALMTALEDNGIDVVVLDWELSGADVMPIVRRLRDDHPGARIVVTSSVNDPADIVAALHLGVLAWIPKHVPFDQLLTGLRTAMRGERWVPGELIASVLEGMSQENSSQRPMLGPLTPREREVLQCLVDGLTREETARLLGMSPNTVRTHVQSVLHKLDVHTSLRAVAIARQAGFTARTHNVPQQRDDHGSVRNGGASYGRD
jgi:DNA-binding NarL/FixJ family response regulator